VIAEGVENQQQVEWLKQHDCLEAQGYLFAKPMSLERLLSWLGERSSR